MAEVQNLLITFMLFAAVIYGMGVFYVSLTESYDLSPTDLRTTQQFERIHNQSRSIQESIKQPGTTGIETVDAFITFTNAAINSILTLFSLPGILAAILSDITLLVPGMPVWFADIIGAIVMIIFLFSGVLYVITKVKI